MQYQSWGADHWGSKCPQASVATAEIKASETGCCLEKEDSVSPIIYLDTCEYTILMLYTYGCIDTYIYIYMCVYIE